MDEFLGPEGYEAFQISMCQADPRLIKPKPSTSSLTQTWTPWQRAVPRVAALYLDSSNGRFGPITEYHDPNKLLSHLRQKASCNVTLKHAIYILEALSHGFAAVLGSHFQLHPAIFSDHERLVAIQDRATGEGGGIPFLPSTFHCRDYISLKYHEPLSLSTPPKGFRNLCETSGRHIAATRIMGRFSKVCIARRKCTFWSRKTDAGGWDCIIICDPPIQRILTSYSGQAGYDVTTSPYNAGYVDFMPQQEQIKCRSGPPRTSFLDDIIFYLHNQVTTLNLDDPLSMRIFVEKIVASQYLKLAEFLQTEIEKIQFSLSRQQDLTSFAIAAVEEQWSDMQGLARRIGEYNDDLEGIMLQLRIPFEDPNLRTTSDWKDTTPDYQYLLRRFKEIYQRSNNLNSSTAALAGLTNNRQAAKAQELALEATERSFHEAKRVKLLTILGMVFIPLTYVASLFSMSDLYRPGQDLFWVYFAVSIPLIGVIVLGYYTMELGYSNGRMNWSFRSAMSTIKETLETHRRGDPEQ